MSIRKKGRRTLHVGVAIGHGRVVASFGRDGSTSPFVHALPGRGDDAGATWPDLAAAFAALREACAGSDLGSPRRGSCQDVILHVALLPPLAYWRRIRLPGLRLAEARQVCGREPSRFLPVSGDAESFALEMRGTGWRRRSPFELVAAPTGLVDAIDITARDSGWRVAEIVAAEEAWAAGATALLPRSTHAAGTLVVPLDDRIEIIGVRGGRVEWLRRLPSRGTDVASALVKAVENDASLPVIVLGRDGFATELRGLLGNLALGGGAADGAASRDDPAALAASFVRACLRPAMLPAAEQQRRRQAARRRRSAWLVAAAALLAATGSLSLWRTSREAAEIATARARIQPAVLNALALRDSLSVTTARLETLRRAAAGTRRWSTLIASLATTLPDDAYLVSMRLDADSVLLEGSAAHSATVLEAMRRMPAFAAVTPEGPIRQEVHADGDVRERFTLSAFIERTR